MNVKNYITLTGESFVINHSANYEPSAEEFPPHFHEAWELLFFLRGEVVYRVNGKEYALRRGDLVLSRPTVLHRIEPTGKERYERINIILDDGIIPRSILERLPEVDVFSFGEGGRVFDIFEKLTDYARLFEGEELLLLSKSLITEVMCNLVIAGGYECGQTVSNPIIAAALVYIDAHLTEISGVDELCEHLYITKSHLHHLFVTHLGVTPKRYINSKRLLLAQRMIRSGERATEVASAVGYSDYATFFRGYKKYFGYAPSEEVSRVSLDAIVG